MCILNVWLACTQGVLPRVWALYNRWSGVCLDGGRCVAGVSLMSLSGVPSICIQRGGRTRGSLLAEETRGSPVAMAQDDQIAIRHLTGSQQFVGWKYVLL